MDDGFDDRYRTRDTRPTWQLRLCDNHKAARALSAHQLELLETGQMRTGAQVLGDMVQENIERLRSWIAERDALIVELGG
jgi:hypothetical protein